MHKSKITLQNWAFGIYLMNTSLKGIACMKLHRELGMTQKTTLMTEHNIRSGWDCGKSKLSGTVEVDESNFGRQDGNQRKSNKLNAKKRSLGSSNATAGFTQSVYQTHPPIRGMVNISKTSRKVLRSTRTITNTMTGSLFTSITRQSSTLSASM